MLMLKSYQMNTHFNWHLYLFHLSPSLFEQILNLSTVGGDALQNHSVIEKSVSLVGDTLEGKILALGTLDSFTV